MCLVPHSDKLEGSRLRSQTKKRHFSTLSAACMQFVFGKTSLAASCCFCVFMMRDTVKYTYKPTGTI